MTIPAMAPPDSDADFVLLLLAPPLLIVAFGVVSTVGAADLTVGATEGLRVGAADGIWLGPFVGLSVGAAVGTRVGVRVGPLGRDVGCPVGCDGFIVGSYDGW